MRNKNDKGQFMAAYNDENLKFISENYRDMTDQNFADRFNVSRTTISNWRVIRLKLMKMVIRPENKPYLVRAKIELKALLAYKYNGIMKDSVDSRIKFLTTIVFGNKN